MKNVRISWKMKNGKIVPLNSSNFCMWHHKELCTVFCSVICTVYCAENSKEIFQEMKLHGLSPNFYIHVSVSDRSTNAFSKIGGPTMGIYKSLTDTRMQKLGTRPRSFISGHIWFTFSVQWIVCTLYCVQHWSFLLPAPQAFATSSFQSHRSRAITHCMECYIYI